MAVAPRGQTSEKTPDLDLFALQQLHAQCCSQSTMAILSSDRGGWSKLIAYIKILPSSTDVFFRYILMLQKFNKYQQACYVTRYRYKPTVGPIFTKFLMIVRIHAWQNYEGLGQRVKKLFILLFTRENTSWEFFYLNGECAHRVLGSRITITIFFIIISSEFFC